MAHIVAVEQHRVAAHRDQLLFQRIGDRRLAGSRKPGEPQNRALLALDLGALGRADGGSLPMDVARPPQREADHPGRGGLLGRAVDQDKAAGIAACLIWIEGDRHVGRDIAKADFVRCERARRRMGPGIDIDPVLQRRNRRRDRAGAKLQPVGAPRDQTFILHPDDMSGELVGEFGTRLRMHQQVAARNIDFVGEG